MDFDSVRFESNSRSQTTNQSKPFTFEKKGSYPSKQFVLVNFQYFKSVSIISLDKFGYEDPKSKLIYLVQIL